MLGIPDGEEETGTLNFRIQALKDLEHSWRPGILIGTGSVQTGKSDQSIYLQTFKSFEISESSVVNMSAGVASLVSDFDEIYGLAGVTISFLKNWNTFVSYDGKSLHEGISWSPVEWLTVAGMMIESETPAVLAGFRYSR